MADPRPEGLADRHPTLYAIGVGGLVGGLISCTFLGWWGLLLAFILFFGSAMVASIADGYEEHQKRQQR